jgi:hypothetical protein
MNSMLLRVDGSFLFSRYSNYVVERSDASLQPYQQYARELSQSDAAREDVFAT